MKIAELYKQKKSVISFEVFPPKKESNIDTIYQAVEDLVELQPDFISVTYGAGGGGSNLTIDVASFIKNKYKIEALPHFTCVTANQEFIDKNIQRLKENNLENILALRGDIPPGFIPQKENIYRYATDLMKEIKGRENFSIGAAAYPEVHIENENMKEEIEIIKAKIDAGAEFLMSQLFFDNSIFYNFQEELAKANINTKIAAGVMPILSKKQIERMIFMCGASLPAKVIKLLTRYENNPEDLQKYAIEYAGSQAKELIDQGVDGIHIYTMNRPEIAKGIMEHIQS